MSFSLVGIRFSFLTAGPVFEIPLPAEFEAASELSSPIRNRNGARAFVFEPSFRDTPLVDVDRLGTLEDADGRAVGFYEQIGMPQWYLEWRLGGGSLTTHLREEDEASMGPITAASMSVAEADSGPFITFTSPLSFGASTLPGYQESAIWFAPGLGGTWAVSLSRPSLVSTGDVLTKAVGAVGGPTIIRAGLPFDLEVDIRTEDFASAEQILAGVEGIAEV